MSELEKSFENIPVTEQAVIEALDNAGTINFEELDVATREFLGKYSNQIHLETNSANDQIANIRAEIHIASVYGKSKNFGLYAIKSLDETGENAVNFLDDDTVRHELNELIETEIARIMAADPTIYIHKPE